MGIIIIIILFQPELKSSGKSRTHKNRYTLPQLRTNSDELTRKWENAIDIICDSCVELSSAQTGAIVIERQVRLGEQIETGTLLEANPSKELFGNIFYRKRLCTTVLS